MGEFLLQCGEICFDSIKVFFTPAPHLPLPVVNGWNLPPSGASETALELFSAAAEGEFGAEVSLAGHQSCIVDHCMPLAMRSLNGLVI